MMEGEAEGPAAPVVLFEPDSPADAIEEYQCHALSWGGCEFRRITVRGARGMAIESPNRDLLRLAFMLENRESSAQLSARSDHRMSLGRPLRAVSLVPSGATVWAASERGGVFELATVAIDPATIPHRLGGVALPTTLDELHLNFVHEPAWRVGLALARESSRTDQFSPLYLDSLVLMLLVQILRQDEDVRPRKSVRLAPLQLKRVTDYLHDNLASGVTLAELSAVVGLSQSHFARAFKASTGMPPHRWQQEARLQKAKTLMSSDLNLSLSKIAFATGFADQSHFTRVFRRYLGQTPAEWRRQQ